jgi:hypothetical protein
VSGALLFSWDAIKPPHVGRENCSRCGRLSGGAGWRCRGGEVGDGVEDEIDVSVGMMYGVELVLVFGFRVEICVGDEVCASWCGVPIWFSS